MLKPAAQQDSGWRNFTFSSAIIFGELAALTGCSGPPAAPPNTNITNVGSFHLHEKPFELGLNMQITSNGESLGSIRQETALDKTIHLNVDPAEIYSYYDQNGNLDASARRRLASPLHHGIDIYDAEGNLIGSLEKKLIKNPISPYNAYVITDAAGNTVATSKKIDFLGTGVSIYDNADNLVAEIKRSGWDAGQADWDIKISGKIDARLIAFIASFKTAADQQKESEQAAKK